MGMLLLPSTSQDCSTAALAEPTDDIARVDPVAETRSMAFLLLCVLLHAKLARKSASSFAKTDRHIQTCDPPPILS